MSRNTRAGGATAGLFLCLSALAIGAASIRSTLAAGADEILVAVAGPMSGPHAAQGRELLAGVERAVAGINAAGGRSGRPIRVEHADDACAADRAAGVARALADKKPELVIGHPCAAAAVAAARVYASQSLTFLAVGPRHPELTDRRAGRTVWRLAGRDDRQGSAAAAWLARRYPRQPLAIVHDRTQMARTLATEVVAALGALGITGVPVHGIVAGERDYGAVIAKLKQQAPAALYFAGFPAEAAVVLKQMRAAGLAAPVIGPDNLATPELVALAGSHISSVYVTRPPSSLTLGALAEAAVQIWAAGGPRPAVEGAGATAADTSLGALAFDAKGDALVPSFEPMRWDGSAWQPVKASE